MTAIPAFADNLAELQVGHVAIGRSRAEQRLGTLEAIAEPEIDDTRHRVRAVDRRGTVGEHLYSLHCSNRDQRDVGEGATKSSERGAGPVDKHERRRCPKAAQVDPATVGRIRSGPISRRRAECSLGHASAKSLRQRLQHLLDGPIAALLDRIAIDRDDRRTDWPRTPNARASNDDGFARRYFSRTEAHRIGVSRPEHPCPFDEFNRQARAEQEAGKGGVGGQSPANPGAASTFQQARSRDDLAAGNVRIFAKRIAKTLCLDVVRLLARLRARSGCIECGRRYARSQNGREKFHRHSSLPCGRFWPYEGKK